MAWDKYILGAMMLFCTAASIYVSVTILLYTNPNDAQLGPIGFDYWFPVITAWSVVVLGFLVAIFSLGVAVLVFKGD